MKSFKWIYNHALEHKGLEDIESLLPTPRSSDEIRLMTDDRILSHMVRRVFRAGLKHSLVDAKWPEFEKAFYGFDPEKVSLMSDEQLEGLMHNDKLIRHWGKIKSTRINGAMVHDLAVKEGSFSEFIASWPPTNITGLWALLKEQGQQMGGNSAAYFLRMVGKDTFVLTDDVVAALIAQGVVSKKPTAKRDLRLTQEAFNQWQQESGRPFCHISRLLAFTVGW